VRRFLSVLNLSYLMEKLILSFFKEIFFSTWLMVFKWTEKMLLFFLSIYFYFYLYVYHCPYAFLILSILVLSISFFAFTFLAVSFCSFAFLFLISFLFLFLLFFLLSFSFAVCVLISFSVRNGDSLKYWCRMEQQNKDKECLKSCYGFHSDAWFHFLVVLSSQ